MTNHSNKKPIRIPITFIDTTPTPQPGDAVEDDDVIELAADPTNPRDFRECVVAEEESEVEPMRASVAADGEARGEASHEDLEAEPAAWETMPAAGGLEPPVVFAKSNENGAAAPAAPAAPRPASEVPLEAFIRRGQEIQQKTEQIERLTAEKKEIQEILLRKQADFDNFRKRSEKETQEIYRRVRGDVVLDFLPVLDNFELALRHAENTDPATLREGVTLIYKQLTDILSRQGLELVEAEGQQFDPEIHEAVAIEPSDDVKDHTVLQEFQRGYRLGDRLLRPARVKVAVQPQ
jgi:molecular chaperone GrpE